MSDDNAPAELGYIKMHRKIKECAFTRCPVKRSVWDHLLLSATHKPYRTLLAGKEIVLMPGQLVSGRKRILKEAFDQKLIKVTEDMVRGALDFFKREGMLTAHTTPSGTVFTIVNWGTYQADFAPQPIPNLIPQPQNQPIPQPEATEHAGCGDIDPSLNPDPFPNPSPRSFPTKQENKNLLVPNGTCPNSAEFELNDLPEEKPSTRKTPPCPHQHIVALYNEILPELQGALYNRWKGSERERNLQARWKESPDHQSLDFWRAYFEAVRTQPHQMGANGWKADLGWLIKRSNFDKLIERFIAQGVWQ